MNLSKPEHLAVKRSCADLLRARLRPVLFAALALGAAACGEEEKGAALESDQNEGELASQEHALTCSGGALPAVTPTLVLTRQTHASILDNRFRLEQVLRRLLDNAGAPASETPTELFHRLFDTLQPQSTSLFPGDVPAFHCQSALNGFATDCPRAEANLASRPITDFQPVAVFNRFDLTPVDGAHCGEYRIVYGLTDAARGANPTFNRVTIIFEGALPNPNPSLGIEACRPVAQFWADLEGKANIQIDAALNQFFFFPGIPGFPNLLQFENFGVSVNPPVAGRPTRGQIRVNLFGNNSFRWQLREYRLNRDSSNVLRFMPKFVASNPSGELFDSVPDSPLTTGLLGQDRFQTLFLDTLTPALVSAANQNVLAMPLTGANFVWNAGQSTAQPGARAEQPGGQDPDDYRAAMDADFRTALQTKLTALGSSLTPENVADRALTQSCAGCHQLSNGDNLGGSLGPWSGTSLGFVHVNESGALSPGLTSTFLPHRQQVLRNFLCGTSGLSAQRSAAGAQQTFQGRTLGGSLTH